MTQRQWVDVGIFAIALFLFFALRSGLAFLWDTFALPTPRALLDFPFTAADIVAFGVVLSGALGVRRVPVVGQFGEEVVAELAKITWPLRREVVASTGIVLVMVGIAALVLFVFDSLWGSVMRRILEF